MKQQILTLVKNEPLNHSTHRLILRGDLPEIIPGQFVNLLIPGLSLRRPFSVCGIGEDSVTICVKSVGRGSEYLSRAVVGEKFDTLTALGRGFNLDMAGVNPLLIGGGSGAPALYPLCKALRARNLPVTVALGAAAADDLLYEREYKALGVKVITYTLDGSAGETGSPILALTGEYTAVYSCGALGLLEALDRATKLPLEFSMEARMGCGFGACMGCTVNTVSGPKRVCVDGPVFSGGELIW